MKPYIIYGIGHFADIIFYTLTECLGREVYAFTVDEKYLEVSNKFNRPVIDFGLIETVIDPHEYSIVIAFLGNDMYQVRKKKFFESKSKGFIMENVIHTSSIVETDSIGEGNIILANNYIGNFTSIGNGNVFWQNVVLPHHNKVGNFSHLAPSVSLSGYSEVCDNCFLGNNSTISNGVIINDFALVGAGAYVKDDIDKYLVIVPAKSFVLENKKSTDFM